MVRINDLEQVVQGLPEGESIELWAPGYAQSPGESVEVDPYDQIEEISERNNTLSQFVPIPTLPPTCTNTPTPEFTPTPTPTSNRGFLVAQIDTDPNPVISGETISLSGGNSEGNINAYQWEIVDDQFGVQITDATSAMASFIAPQVSEPTVVTVGLTVMGVCCSPPIFDAEDVEEINIVIIPANDLTIKEDSNVEDNF